ncbi:hypothetical protein Emed_000890 [Eimeria media]
MFLRLPLQKTDDSSLSQVDNSKGIYMYASQASEDGDCAAAVLHWKSAINNFTELPPAYSTETPSPYTDPLNISFVGLYNPGQNPTVDCAVITCQPETQTGEGGPPSSKVGDGAEDETEKKEVYSLVCLSTPQALQASQKPFTIFVVWGAFTNCCCCCYCFSAAAAAVASVLLLLLLLQCCCCCSSAAAAAVVVQDQWNKIAGIQDNLAQPTKLAFMAFAREGADAPKRDSPHTATAATAAETATAATTKTSCEL